MTENKPIGYIVGGGLHTQQVGRMRVRIDGREQEQLR